MHATAPYRVLRRYRAIAPYLLSRTISACLWRGHAVGWFLLSVEARFPVYGFLDRSGEGWTRQLADAVEKFPARWQCRTAPQLHPPSTPVRPLRIVAIVPRLVEG